ncbi:uncharacterized protein LOC131155419 isoform X2 [Malania oleifera]|uniref:uncharacterized protein LOC131155419 isoform X2 n=1 Tax=Malania oleifera TaxID=397392 RepID=UPI0025AE6800|nr:uncharacterized protein LOC131155419 isoform X2 [Malania oleifera]
MDPASTSSDMEITKKELFKTAMEGKWDEVEDIYSKKPTARGEKITRTGDTALHIAVSDGREEIVQKLVNYSSPDALSVKNNLGNTALHLAATMGNVAMCFGIAKKNLKLVGERNIDNETPFFLAALHGKKDAFLCLHSLIGGGDEGKRSSGLEYSRKGDGDNILHCAIAGEYFDLAFQIIHLYPELANYNNELGLSPLHILACKPSAFRSGSHLSRSDKIIYHCILVEDLKETPPPNLKALEKLTKPPKPSGPSLPDNYETCFSFSKLLWHIIKYSGKICTAGAQKSGEEPKNPKSQKNYSTWNNCIQLLQNAIRVSSDSSGHVDMEDPRERQKEGQENPGQHEGNRPSNGAKKYSGPLPPNYEICFEFIKIIYKSMLVILGLGIRKLRVKKEKHIWSIQVLDKLLFHTSLYEYDDAGSNPGLSFPSKFNEISAFDEMREKVTKFGNMRQFPGQESSVENSARKEGTGDKKDGKNEEVENTKTSQEKKKEKNILIATKDVSGNMVEKIQEIFPVAIHDINNSKNSIVLLAQEKEIQEMSKKETPILVAAKNGITEIVEGILKQFPVAIHDINSDKKNMVHLAVEHRQPHVYVLLMNKNIPKDTIFAQVDNEGNSALHLAAILRDYQPWNIPGVALQLQWEIKWFKYVKDSMPLHFFARYNKRGKTPKDIFIESHKDLVQKGGEWLNSTSESCSVVSALIATVAFATSATVPGGNSDNGKPTLEHQPAFNVFAISSLIALSFSVTSVIMFLAILTSRHQEKDFGRNLPIKLLLGLTSLFISIGAILLCFCAGHFFVLRDELRYAAIPIYGVTCLPITFFAMAQFPLYFDLLWAILKPVPQRSYKTIL